MVAIFEMTDTRVWVIDVYEGVYFNDFIRVGIGNDIKKRIIVNGLTGNSLTFKRFDRIYISVNSDKGQNLDNLY